MSFLGIQIVRNDTKAQMADHQDQTSKSPNVPKLVKPIKAARPKISINAMSAPLLVFLDKLVETIPAVSNINATQIPASALVSEVLSSSTFTIEVAHD